VTTTRPTFAPWDERSLSRIVSPEESARRVRTFAAVEERAGQLLEAFAGSIGVAHAASTLERHAKHHAYHAELLRSRVADANGSAGDTVEDADVAAFLDVVGEPKDSAQAVEFLTGIYRVLLPRAISAYTYFLTALGADAADADERWYGLILKDLHDGIRDGELLLQTLLLEGGDAAVQRSADRRAQLETLILKAGGIVGPDSLGGAPTTSKETTR
jgi:hypothetical protein